MKLEDGEEDHYYRDNNGDFYGLQESDKEDKTFIKVGTPEAEAYEAELAAQYERARTEGHERFADMSDEEL
jgi:hypothetical protein